MEGVRIMTAPMIGYVMLTLEAYREGKAYVSRCRELGVASCGDTLDEAMTAIREATTDYLNAIDVLGERHRIFAEKGIVIHKSRPKVTTSADAFPPEKDGIARRVVLPLPRAA